MIRYFWFTICILLSFFCNPKEAYATNFYLPVDDSEITLTVTSGWKYPDGATHHGIDYAGGINCTTPVVAAASGTVTIKQSSGCPNTYPNGPVSFGCNLEITHSDGYATRYSHLCDGSTTVSDGEAVVAGQVIAYMGTSGYSTGTHLDFRVAPSGCVDWNLSSACLVDPYNIYNGPTYYPDDGTSVSEVSGNLWTQWPPVPADGSSSSSTTSSVHLMTVEPSATGKFDIYGYEVSGSGNSTTLSGDFYYTNTGGNPNNTLSWLSGDVDDDGWDDVIQVRTKSGYTYARAYLSLGDGSLDTKAAWLKTLGTASKAFLIDMNADGMADIVLGFANSDTTMTWKYFASTGSSFNTTATNWTSSFGKSSDIFVMGDFNNNGKGELLRGREDDGVTDSNFTSTMTWKRLDTNNNTSTVLNSYGYSADKYLVADVDSDDDDDLIRIDLADSTAMAYVIKYSNSSNEFGVAATFATDVGDPCEQFFTNPIDFTDPSGYSYPDLIVTYPSSTVSKVDLFLQQNDSGTSFEEQSAATPLVNTLSSSAIFLFGNFGNRTSTSIQSVDGILVDSIEEDDLLDPATFHYTSLDLMSQASVDYIDLSTNPSGYVNSLTGQYRIVFTGRDGNIYQDTSDSDGAAWTWDSLTLSAYYWVPYVRDGMGVIPFLDDITGDEEALFIGEDGDLWTMTIDGSTGGITSTDASAHYWVQYANYTSEPSGYYDPNTGDLHLIFVDTAQHVWQMIRDGSTGGWISQDLSALTGLTVYPGTSAQTFMDPIIGDHYVLFTGADKRIKLLITSNNSTWAAIDLDNYAAVDYSVSTPVGFVHPTTEEFYVYLMGENKRVYEIHYNLSTWSGTDLSALAAVPYGDYGTSLSAVVNPLTGDTLVTFDGDNYRINQFRYRNGSWSATDLSSQASVTYAQPGTTPQTFVDPFSGAETTIFTGNNARVQVIRHGP